MGWSQSAFVRGFIDDYGDIYFTNCSDTSQSAFVRGFIDDGESLEDTNVVFDVSIRVRARLHR